MTSNNKPVEPIELEEVTSLLEQAKLGDSAALNEAFTVLRDQLHRAASGLLKQRPSGATLGATALMHEAYIRTAEACAKEHLQQQPPWKDREHFVASQLVTMRNLLVDTARSKGRRARVRGVEDILSVEQGLDLNSAGELALLVDDACQELAKREPLAAQLAEMHYFGGFTWAEAGEILGLSARQRITLRKFADAWFLTQLREGH